MAFLDFPTVGPSTIEVPPDGHKDAKLCIIGEAPSMYEIRAGRPFVGPAGAVLEQCLHSAGLIRADAYITNLIPHKIYDISKYYNDRTDSLTDLGKKHAARLQEELSDVQAEIFIPLGNPATCAMIGTGKITKRRGYLTESTLLPGRKVLPTIHPSAAIRGNYIYRYHITTDLRKARMLLGTEGFGFPDIEYIVPRTLSDVMLHLTPFLYDYGRPVQHPISVDIEVMNHEVSVIGFCNKDNYAVVIPFYGSPPPWTEAEEVQIWDVVAEILEDPRVPKIGQNFIFDMQFLAQSMGIITRGTIHDTMIKGSLMFPDFPKSLEFLVSVHLNRPYWKDLIKWSGEDIVKGDS